MLFIHCINIVKVQIISIIFLGLFPIFYKSAEKTENLERYTLWHRHNITHFIFYQIFIFYHFIRDTFLSLPFSFCRIRRSNKKGSFQIHKSLNWMSKNGEVGWTRKEKVGRAKKLWQEKGSFARKLFLLSDIQKLPFSSRFSPIVNNIRCIKGS